MSNSNNANVSNLRTTGEASTIDAHYEANYKEKTLIEINRNRLNRKISNLEAHISAPMIVLDKLKVLSWSGIPSCKFKIVILLICSNRKHYFLKVSLRFEALFGAY